MTSAARTAAVLSALLASLLLAAPAVADTYTVTNTDNAGPGSLRQAIIDANDHANSGGPDLIRSTLPADTRIVLATELPPVTDRADIDLGGATIDASSIDGDGLRINGHADTAMADMIVVGYEGKGISIDDATDVGVRSTVLDGEGDGDVGIFSGLGSEGTDVRDSVVRRNTTGIEVRSSGFTLAGSTVAENTLRGVFLRSAFANLTGNSIGPNGGDGILIENGFANNIGVRDSTVAANRIENHGGNGINIVDGVANFVWINVFNGNALGPINLGDPGREENDVGDGDAGPNFLQNFPTITFVDPQRISGTLNTNADTDAIIQFFADPAGGANLSTYLGTVQGRTDGDGNFSFDHVPLTQLVPGWSINTFATTQDGSGPPFTFLFQGGQPGGPPGSDPPPQPSPLPATVAALQLFSAEQRRRVAVQSLTLTLQGRNLKTWTDYRGLDPESLPPNTSYSLRETLIPRAERVVARSNGATLAAFPNFRNRGVVPFQKRKRRVRTTRTFTSLPEGRRIAVRYRLRAKKGRKLPQVLRFKVRQRFTLSAPGYQPLVVKRTRKLRIRR